MKQYIFAFALVLIAPLLGAQDWPGFLSVLNSDWHETPYGQHEPDCWLSDVHVNEDQSEGVAYVAFGYGRIAAVSCDVNDPPTAPNWRAFTLALNNEGEVMEVRTFSHVPYPCGHQRWNNGNLWTPGGSEHSYKDQSGNIVALLNNSENGSLTFNENSYQFLHTFSPSGEPVETPSMLIEGSPLHHYEMGGIFPDTRDTTRLVYGRELIRDEVDGPFASTLAVLKKLDHSGNELWSRTYPNTAYVGKIIVAQTGGYWLSVIGSTASSQCSVAGATSIASLMIMRVDRNGIELDRFVLNEICSGHRLSLVEVEPNVCIAFSRGQMAPSSPWEEIGTGHFFSYLFEYTEESSSGVNIEASDYKMYMPNDDVDGLTKAMRVDDGFLLSGYQSSVRYDEEAGTDNWQQRAMLFKLDENRDSVWTRFYSSTVPGVPAFWREHAITDFKPTPDGGYVCVGYMRHNNIVNELDPALQGLRSAYALKVDAFGCLEPGCQFVGVDEMAIDLRGSLTAFPNPASTTLTVQLNFPEHTAPGNGIELVMHDLQGRIVYRQNHPELGNGEARIEVGHLPAGLYTLHCTVDGVWIDATKIVVE